MLATVAAPSVPSRSPIDSVEAVLARMSELLVEFERKGDPRAVFLRSYRIITARVRDQVATTKFTDAVWLAALDVQFAQAYFDAVEGYEAGTAIPRCWQLAFDLAKAGRTSVIADLTLGMNAHIFHDLPIAVYELGLGTLGRDVRQQDYTLVDGLLALEINEVQRQISRHYSFGLWLLDRAGHGADELFTDQGLRAARAVGWQNAVRLLDAPDAAARARLMQEFDRLACTAGALFQSGPLAEPNWFTRFLRRVDRKLASWFWPKPEV
jgi:hypothetical protein